MHRHSVVNFSAIRGKDVKTIQELLRHAKVSTTLDVYSQSIDAAKLKAQEAPLKLCTPKTGGSCLPSG
jgi:site-specific recombinase XerD